MPAKKEMGKHFLPACSSQGSFKIEGSIGSVGSKRELTKAEIPASAEQIVPINFGLKYNPSLLGLEYYIVGAPQTPLVYEIPMGSFVNSL